MQNPMSWSPMPIGNLLLLMTLFLNTVDASSDSYTFWFHSISGSHKFEMQSFEDQGIRQIDFLNDRFKRQFQSVKDLTPDRVTSFLNKYPENRDALILYLIDLPEYLLIDAHRIRLLQTIERFRADTASPQKIQTTSFNTAKLLERYKAVPHILSAVRPSAKPVQKNSQHSVSADLLSRPIHYRDSGFDFRFYRGLLLEYHFSTPALLSFDVRRQRFELQWDFD